MTILFSKCPGTCYLSLNPISIDTSEAENTILQNSLTTFQVLNIPAYRHAALFGLTWVVMIPGWSWAVGVGWGMLLPVFEMSQIQSCLFICACVIACGGGQRTLLGVLFHLADYLCPLKCSL